MTKNNIYFFDDHKGNKALVITKGDYTDGLVSPKNCFKISDPAFKPTTERLAQLLDKLNVKKIKTSEN